MFDMRGTSGTDNAERAEDRKKQEQQYHWLLHDKQKSNLPIEDDYRSSIQEGSPEGRVHRAAHRGRNIVINVVKFVAFLATLVLFNQLILYQIDRVSRFAANQQNHQYKTVDR